MSCFDFCCPLSKELFGFKRGRGNIEIWADQYEEDAIEPELRIFDAHHHMWHWGKHYKMPPALMSQATMVRAYKLNPQLTEKIYFKPVMDKMGLGNSYGHRSPFCTPYMPENMMKDIRGKDKGGHNIVGTAFVEAGWYGPEGEEHPALSVYGETVMASEINKANPLFCQGIIGDAHLSMGKDIEILLQKYQANPLVRGVRDTIDFHEEPMPDMFPPPNKAGKAYDPKFREAFALLEKYGLCYDSWQYHWQIKDFSDLAKAFPGTTMICDHMSFPLGLGKYKREESFEEWKKLMPLLAQCPNVYVKISAMGMRFFAFGFDERDFPPTSDELAKAWEPYVTHTINTMGVDKCILASNFPMDKITCSYTVMWNALKKCVKNRTPAEKEKLFELNALKCYGIPRPP